MADGRALILDGQNIADAIFLATRQSPDPVIVQARTQILYANAHALQLFGYASVAEMRRIPAQQTIAPEDREDALRYNTARFSDPPGDAPSEYQITLMTKDRTKIPAKVYVMMVPTNAGPLSLVTFHPHGHENTDVLRQLSESASNNIVNAREDSIKRATEPLEANALAMKEILLRLEKRVEKTELDLSNGLKSRMREVEIKIDNLHEALKTFTDDKKADRRSKITIRIAVVGLCLGLLYQLWDKVMPLWKGHVP